LTELGWEQARQAGRRLRNDILKASSSSATTTTTSSSSSLTAPPPPPRQVHFIVSPYVRTVETFHGIVSAWCDPSEFAHIPNRDARIKAWYSKLVEMGISWAEDPRIREQVRFLLLLLLFNNSTYR
jgi:broad specificity phosphatase PhoE